MWHIRCPYLKLKMVFTIDSFCPLDEPLRCIVSQASPGPLWTLCCFCLLCVHCSDLWPLCLCLQITSEVHLLSHTKGKRHQQAVRDSSNIQGRELSDEEVVRASLTLILTLSRSLSLSSSLPPSPSSLLTLTHTSGTNIYCPPYCSRRIKTERDTALVFYDMVIIIVPASLYTAAALLQALFNCKWAVTCTLLWFSASAAGWHHPLLTPGCFCHEAPLPQEGSSLMQVNLSGCNMRLPFQRCSLWSWQLLVLYAAPLAHAALPFKAYFSEVSNWYIFLPFFFPLLDNVSWEQKFLINSALRV